MSESTPENAPDSGDDLFEELLATGTVRREKVDIYFNQEAINELEAIASEVDDISGPETINQTSRLREIEKRWEEAHARYEASKVTFTLTPVDAETTAQIWDDLPNPPVPENPGKARWPVGQNGPDRERIIKQREAAEARWHERMEVWRKESSEQETRRMTRILCASIEKVESKKGDHPGMTESQLDAIRSAKLGTQRINLLWEGFQRASKVAGEIERPF